MVANLAIGYSVSIPISCYLQSNQLIVSVAQGPALIEEFRKDGFIMLDIEHCSHDAQSFTPKFSNKPTDTVPFIRQDGGDIRLESGKWSIQGPPGRGQVDIINANANTVAEGGRFYSDMRSSRRAIVACDG